MIVTIDDRPADWEALSTWIAELIDGAADDVVWIHGDENVTRGDLIARVEEFTDLFQRDGIGPGTTVALRIGPSCTLFYVLFGLWRCGAQVLLVDSRAKPAEVDRLFRRYEPQFELHSDTAGEIRAVFRATREVLTRSTGGGRPAQGPHCLVQSSSGSTGRPKIIGRTAASLQTELDRIALLAGAPAAGERVLLLGSMSHSFGLIVGVLHSLRVNATLVLTFSVRPRELLDLAARQDVAMILGVPTHFELLASVFDPPPLPSLRGAVCAGDVLDRGVFDLVERRLGIRLGQVYGMTEVGVIAADLTGRLGPQAVGVPLPGITVRCSGGELFIAIDETPYVRSDGIVRVVDGWLRTFDRADQDAETGALRILGRTDSVIAIGGLKVDLTEIEAVLHEHEQVNEAVVTYHEVIEAHVGVSGVLSTADLLSWCRERLSHVKVPKRVHLGPALPRTATGKLIRDRDLLHAARPRVVD
ncbi:MULTISPECIES: class I adenylate-forming enzyme family protein [Actinoalloteichus]|uniref:Acyl-CoA synthetase (AMP-forming)/AMP-acid ligase II n=1 Tax=Actinoalloteichus fjordicus TaxID=1612552 RepID=A0AAC9LAJ8_9PSEU|nr:MULTISPECIES: AMP-binding protein [Actinoalloteichus]APU13365.1 acyl-CoA synthetase (AMP-forming)/AMP-acid ligase II [Actinoalloteichus fjordicus]APU19315.1 acyl-CoA synthetase (AMP-forming)/AMP-acid ligase II [Actinoalloteichus sp. GBA129-24]